MSAGDPQATAAMASPPCTHSLRPTSPMMGCRGAPLLPTVFDGMGAPTTAGESATAA